MNNVAVSSGDGQTQIIVTSLPLPTSATIVQAQVKLLTAILTITYQFPDQYYIHQLVKMFNRHTITHEISQISSTDLRLTIQASPAHLSFMAAAFNT